MPDVQTGRSLQLNRPKWFRDPEFIAFLESGEAMTWHKAGLPTEYSDVVVMVDPGCSGEGPDSDNIPRPIWDQIVHTCTETFGQRPGELHYLVWITNIEE